MLSGSWTAMKNVAVVTFPFTTTLDHRKGARMTQWYHHYESQCWYTNTFLVNEFFQIGRARTRLGEWNNIHGCGCNFVCIAMMLGLNPAYLASLLGRQGFFREDRTIPARRLAK